MNVTPDQMLKTLVCRSDDGWILAVLRGDHDLVEGKLRDACGCSIGLADEDQARAAGFAVGFVSPAAAKTVDITRVVVDPDAAQPQAWITGADRIDYHVRNFDWRRELGDFLDSDKLVVADIRSALDGDPSPRDDRGTLRAHRGIEVGHVFKLGSKYSDAMGFTVLDKNQKQRPVIMGCYGIGPGRILAAAIETSHDEDGIIWPAALAPYAVHIVPIKLDDDLRQTLNTLIAELDAAGLDVLVDDRPERPGVKFKDADLVGCPIRLTIGAKTLAAESVELKLRSAGRAKGELVPLVGAAGRCVEELAKYTTVA